MRTSAALTLALGLGLTGAAVTPVPPSQDTLVARALSVSELESSTALHLLQSRGLLEDVWDAITDAASCAGCQVSRDARWIQPLWWWKDPASRLEGEVDSH